MNNKFFAPLVVALISYTSYQIYQLPSPGKYSALSYTRNPASEDDSCANALLAFYKNQDLDRMKSRITATKKDPHKFYRSFPPLYFKIIEDLNLEQDLGSVFKHQSVIGGDVHVENFGVRPFKGKLKILINDFDDLSEGHTVIDVIRLLTSMKLSGYDVDKKFIKEFMQRYLEGIKGEKENFSEATMRFFKTAKKVKRIDKKKIDVTAKTFLKKREPSFDMTEKEIKAWEKIMTPYGTVVDQYKYVKESGGSGGLDRFELLIEKDGELIWVEAKEWDVPGINAGLNTTPPTYQKRIEYVHRYDQPEFPSQTAKYNGKTFFLREINDSHTGLSLDEIKKNEMKDLYLDEAYALGDFHRTFDASKEYISDIKNLKAGSIEDAVLKVYDEILAYVEKN
jgi:hypothetical protein